MKNYFKKSIIILFIAIGCSLNLFAVDINALAHSCLKQNTDTITFRFTIPTSASIGNVRVDFNISDLSGVTLGYGAVSIDPQCGDLAYSPFTVSNYEVPHTVASPNGYSVQLISKGTNSFQVWIINTSTSGVWDTDTDASCTLSQPFWEIIISGMGISDYYGLNLTQIRAYAAGVTDEGSPMATPAGLLFTYVDTCNQPPIATFTETAGTGSTIYTSDASTIYGPVPLLLNLTPDMTDPDGHHAIQYRWDLDGDGTVYEVTENFPTPIPVSTPAPANQIKGYDSIGINNIGLIVQDETTADSTRKQKTVYVLPSENMYFARASGLPYDEGIVPHIDGIVSGPDEQAETGGSDEGVIYGESGWRGAYQQVYGTGTGFDFIFQGIRHNVTATRILYFSFEVAYDNALNSSDEIIIGFRGNSTDPLATDISTDRKIVIDPSANTTGTAAQTGIQVFERSGGSWSTTANSSLPPDLVCATRPLNYDPLDSGVDDNYWSIEIQVPLDAHGGSSWEAINDQFLFFYRIGRHQSSTVDYGYWPTSLNLAPADDYFIDNIADPGYDWTTTRLNPLWWGAVDLTTSSACNGLSLASSVDVGSIPVDTAVTPGYNAASLAESGTLTSSFAYTDPSPGSVTDVGYSNTFTNIVVARVSNDTYKQEISGGSIVDTMLNVPDVDVSFKIANWGIPPDNVLDSYWKEIPGSSAVAAKEVPKGTADPITPHKEEFYFEWPLDVATIQQYIADSSVLESFNEKHQCIYVEIHADPNTSTDADDINNPRIVIKSVHRNMNFNATNDDKFVHQADISAIGYGDALTDDPNQKFLLRIFTRKWEVNLSNELVQNILKGKENEKEEYNRISKIPEGLSETFYNDLIKQKDLLLKYMKENKNVVSYIEYIVKGFLYTGKTAIIKGKPIDVVRAVGSYGHVIRHEGLVEDWEFEITGENVIMLNKNTYLLSIEPETTLRVFDKVKAIEPSKWMVHLYGGVAYNIDTFSSDYTLGVNGLIGLGYKFFPMLSCNLMFGYNYFFSDNTAVDDSRLMNISLNARWHRQLANPVSVYVDIGPGIYLDPDMTIDFGANAGLGVDIEFTPYVVFELGADYHYLFKTDTTQFIHGHAGLQFMF
ncbi:MAG: outer membrane beta-barrel protein [Spirochaetales bacterium]|nr:outer membrane beta-barrel protein [Spirochaetales bacterium]